jgi:N,N'-diacetyllegionaminate synthase
MDRQMSKNFFKKVIKSKTPIIIAELGAKYAKIELIKKMIKISKKIDVDVVKIQTYKANTISSDKGHFIVEGKKLSQYNFFKKYEFSDRDHINLDNYCKKLNIPWTSTPSHFGDVDYLEKFNLPFYKTGSDDLTNLPFLRYIAKKNKPMVISTGMCSLKEIEVAVNNIFKAGNSQIILLHCVVSYPSLPEESNLNAINTLMNEFNLPVGLSDHSQSELTSVIATSIGAKVIEKHLTLDYSLKLPDYQASLEPDLFSKMIKSVRTVKLALGDGEKKILKTEKTWRKNARKSIFYSKNIDKNSVITENDLAIRRPGNGLHPHYYDELIGKTVYKKVKKNQLVKTIHFK